MLPLIYMHFVPFLFVILFFSQFQLPKELQSRMYHMSCSYHIQDCQTDVIVFGGNKRRQSKFDRNVITSPVIIRFGKINAPTTVFTDLFLKVWPKN